MPARVLAPSLRCVLVVAAVLALVAPVFVSAAAAPDNQTAETATQFYLRWRSTVLTAKSLDEITPFWTAETRDEISMEPEAARAETLPMAKRFLNMQTDVKVVKETATPNGATLALEGLDADRKPIVSTVEVVKENGAWKMTAAVERWKPKG